MLYIASALTPTPILDTLRIPSFTDPNSTSLIIAKPDRIEVWNVDATGLVYQAKLEVWGTIVGIEKVEVEGARPHILVLLSPPQAHLLLVTFTASPAPSLIVTSSIPLTPPTPSLRQAEFFTSVLAHDKVALVSLWVGVLSCIEMEVEKDKDAKKRRASAAGMEVDEDGRRLKFRDNFNINIREHNLLHLSFLPDSTTSSGPIVSFLWMTATNDLQLQTRALSITAHAFNDLSRPVDVVSPTSSSFAISGDTDFNDIPFSCPAARRVLPISGELSNGERSLLVLGDEHSVLYTLSSTPQSPKVSRRLSSTSGPGTSPRASARRSPQTELVSSVSKRRKSSMGTKNTSSGEEQWELKPVWRVRQGFGIVLAASVLEVHSTGASVLIGDECGRLTAIGWEFDRNQGILESTNGQNGTVRLRKVDLGTSSPPSSLTYLDSSHVFLSSAVGDSLLLRLDLSASAGDRSAPSSPTAVTNLRGGLTDKGKGKARDENEESSWAVAIDDKSDKGSTETRERWMNIAPVKDFCLVEEEGGGLSHIVIASGASNANSLRVVRSGVGLEEVVNVEGVQGVERMWPLTDSSGTTRLLLSSWSSSYILQIEPEIAIIEIAPQLTSAATLAAGVLPGSDLLVQVTSGGVQSWSDVTTGLSAGSVAVDKGTEIIAAQVLGDLVIVGKRGGEVLVFAVSSDGFSPVVDAQISSEISAVSIIQSTSLPSPVIAVGTWFNEIILYTLDQLKAGDTSVTTLSEQFFASSLYLKPSIGNTTSTSGIQLFAGLSDGSLIIYDLEPSGDNANIVVKSRKASSLGMRPLNLCPVEGATGSADEQVVAVGLTERMSVVFQSKDRIDFSSVSRKDVTAATAIRTPTFGNSLVLASTSGLSLVRVNSLKKLYIQTLDLGDRSANKVVSLNDQKVLGVGATVRTMDQQTGEVLQSSFLEIRDAATLSPLAEMPLKEREEVTCLKEVFLLGRNYLAMGTAVLPPDSEDEPAWDDESLVNVREGRVVLVEPKSEGDQYVMRVVAAIPTVGPVYDLAVIHGFLAIAAGSKVSINRLDLTPPGLTEISSFSSAFIASHLTVTPKSKLASEDRLVLGDGMRSIIILEVDEGNGKVYDDQRDLATHSVVAMERVTDGGEGVVIADGHSNVLTFRLKEGIESAATFGLHEEITRFQPGSLAPPSSAPDVLVPDLLFATREGRLGIVGELKPSAAKTLDDLQRNLDRAWKGPGDIGWRGWRRGGTELVKRDMAGFIDGDFVQKFLDSEVFSASESEKIIKGGSALEHVCKIGSSGKEVAERGDVVRVLEAAAGMH
ncbi:hypothetical protein CI109_104814 [Kwoniella shandongensis]|uniref:Uncharacterized protein n=1 Tax=Kwoniella shandongensis TaxID=1734106 RepID=A0A5M6BRU5_9TREE|nr:uncharacterized protein CI109_006204 [Kwoniella shandongensis]KAA5525513.1 hypothetical protein CI109_006204 [Kwoniella shandongensis]